MRPDQLVAVVGSTRSSTFPTTSGAFQEAAQGGEDGYLACVDPALATLVWSTRLGGAEDDALMRVVSTADGRLLVTGGSRSNDFPVTVGAYDTIHNGNDDALVTAVSADGSELAWSTLLGGTDADRGLALAQDAQGNVTVLGYTLSLDLPTTTGAFDTSANGSYDVFVHQFDPTGSQLRLGTFLGGDARDETYAVQPLDGGRVLLIGVTESTGFPTTVDAYQTVYADNADAFVALLDLTVWSVGVTHPPLSTIEVVASPNPFNPCVEIAFRLGEAGRVRVAVHDPRGQLVRAWTVEAPDGSGRVSWDGRDRAGRSVAAGTYLYSVGRDDLIAHGKLSLVR